jgi:hypothetical protein
MTAKEAKEKTLYIWRYIAAHPEIAYKTGLPQEMWLKIAGYVNICPLCAWFLTRSVYEGCRNCPLEDYSFSGYICGIYQRWRHAKTNEERQQAANELVAKVEVWEVEECAS